MTIDYKITYQDCRDAAFLNMKPRLSIAVAGILMISLILGIIIFEICSSKPMDKNIPIMILLLLCFPGYFLCYLPWQIKRNFKRSILLKHKSKSVIDEKGIHSSSDIANSSLPWNHFDRYKANKKLILIYIKGGIFLIFPKHLFTDLQWSELNETLRDKFNSKLSNSPPTPSS